MRLSSPSQYEKKDISYSVQYRKAAGNGDDEKEEEWKEQILEKESDSVKITKLNAKSEYDVCSRYQIVANSVWSQLSKVTKFVTTDFPKFEWDPNRMDPKYTLSNEGRTFTSNERGWKSLFSKTMLSSKTMNTVIWQMRYNGPSGKNGHIRMGVVAAHSVGNVVCNNAVEGTENTICLDMYKNGIPYARANGTRTQIRQQRIEWEPNNTVELRFDLKAKTCNVFVNDEEIGLLTSDLPEEMYLAASLYYEESNLETTVFQVM